MPRVSLALPIVLRVAAGSAVLLALTAGLTSGHAPDAPAPGDREEAEGRARTDGRPNILLIVADDLGYADLGAFGSDIRTPNIDRLAAEGLLFTHFHTAPMCAPTRAMLLTGNNNHVAGMGRQSPSEELARVPGYEGYLSERVVPFPRLLREAGYHTYSAGKWHLGNAREHSPPAAGFERSYQLTHGAANHFNSVGFFEGGSLYREDGEEVEYPAGTYTTELFTDRLIEFIDSAIDDGRPFFAYAAYTSPHWPLQVPDEWLDLYRGDYDDGYDALRERNFQALKAAGILTPEHTLPPRNEDVVPWEDLGAEQRRIEARKMELYAAMVENLDHHVGRLIEHLEARGLYDNTLIVFMSDNGAAGSEDFYYTGPFVEYLQAHYDNSYENMGKPDSWISYGAPWAEAGSAPFSRYKTYTRQGGIAAPMIVAGPGVVHRGEISRAYVTVMDLAPTFLELGGATYPDDHGPVRPMEGESMAALLAGEASRVHAEDYVTTLFHAGRAFLRRGRWKLTNLDPPFDESAFELFDVEADPGETTNLAETHPEIFREMIGLWRSERERLGIVLPGEVRPDSLPWRDLAAAVVERMALLPGERVLLLGTPGRFGALVEPLRRAVVEAGGEVAGAYTVRAPEGGAPGGAYPWDDVLDGDVADLQRRLADVDVGVMFPGATVGHAAYVALQRNLEELGGPRRTIHFHWGGAYGLDNRLHDVDDVVDATYVDAVLHTDYAALAAAQAAWIDRARRGTVRVTTPEGTDVSFRIGDRPVTRQDGDASAARALRARNLIDREIELPAGAVRVAPLEESVNGVIAFPPTVWRGEAVHGLRMWFERGTLTRWEAETGHAAVEADLAEGGEAARSFRELALGFNPRLRVRRHPIREESWIPYYGYGEGVIRLSLGDNTELGGEVRGGYVRWNFFVGGDVAVDVSR